MKITVLVTYGRSGSSYLCELLNEHSELLFEGEIFNRSRNDLDSFKGSFHKNVPFRLLRVLNRDRIIQSTAGAQLLRPIYRSFLKKKEEKTSHYGFKVTADQLRFDPNVKHIVMNNAQVILLLRKDHLRQALSMLKAREFGNYTDFSNTRQPFDAKRVFQEIKGIMHWEKIMRDTFSNPLHIFSEDLFDNRTEVLSRIHTFMRLSQSERFPNTLPPSISNAPNIRSWVSNYDQLEEHYKQMDW